MAVSFKMFRRGKEVGSGRRKTNRTTPIVEPAGDYVFTLSAASSTESGLDRFEVTGVHDENRTAASEGSRSAGY
jgi:hypothetical protein